MGKHTDAYAQYPNFERYNEVPVIENKQALPLAWAGGLNLPVFSGFDANADGFTDLFVFDKANDFPMVFINCGLPDTLCFTYHPELAPFFPEELEGWALMADFNFDKNPDLFTYYIGNIRMYYGGKTLQDGFQLITNKLVYKGKNSILNIPSTVLDLPAFVDVANDGDLDIISFDFAGAYASYYENRAQELTGTSADTLFFNRITRCWGGFKESDTSSTIILETGCAELWEGDEDEGKTRHAGSTILAYDPDKDGDQDLILGDVSSSRLVRLFNTGDTAKAWVTAQDAFFPSYDTSAYLPIFPAAFKADVTNDGLDDLIASTTDFYSTSFDQVWLYKNIAPTPSDTDRYTFVTKHFLAGNKLDVGVRAYPAFQDYNNDSLPDLFVGNYGVFDSIENIHKPSLALYENTGTKTHPEFTLVTRNFANLAGLGFRGIYPSFADLDGDNDADLIIGTELGNLHYFKNTAPSGEKMQLTPTKAKIPPLPPQLSAASPTLYDVNADGLPDLIVGSSEGKLRYYQNITQPSDTLSFTLIDNFWGKVNVNLTGAGGYSSPLIFYPDTTANSPVLLVNADNGRVFCYTNLTDSVFTLLDSSFAKIYEGGRGGLSAAKLRNNELYSLAVGNQRGGLALFTQDLALNAPPSLLPTTAITPNKFGQLQFLPNPGSNNKTSILTIQLVLPDKIFQNWQMNNNKAQNMEFIFTAHATNGKTWHLPAQYIGNKQWQIQTQDVLPPGALYLITAKNGQIIASGKWLSLP